jgi:DNA primase
MTGRIDAEWLRLFSLCAVTEELGEIADSLPFGTVFGIAPTHDACVVDTVEKIKDIRSGVVALVDGDAAGDDYVKTLLKATKPPEHVVQWPNGSEIEDVVGWVLGNEQSLVQTIRAEISTAPATMPEIVAWLKKPTKEKGAKTDLLAYEAVTTGILMSAKAKARARSLLGGLVDMTGGKPSSKLLQAEKARSTGKTSVWRLALEP